MQVTVFDEEERGVNCHCAFKHDNLLKIIRSDPAIRDITMKIWDPQQEVFNNSAFTSSLCRLRT